MSSNDYFFLRSASVVSLWLYNYGCDSVEADAVVYSVINGFYADNYQKEPHQIVVSLLSQSGNGININSRWSGGILRMCMPFANVYPFMIRFLKV